MESNQSRPDPREHMGARIVIVIVVAAILVLISAFIWPGWAHRKAQPSQAQAQAPQTSQVSPARTVKFVPLPQGATKLEEAMPNYVGSYARISVKPATTWQKGYPIEEWVVTYDDGQDDVTLLAAQWPLAGNAAGEYSSLSSALQGTSLSSGKVTVNGAQTGNYEVKEEEKPSQTTALWQNSTCVFEATGPGKSAQSFWRAFPF
ncbi:MAG: hypothetical protein IKS61_01060 [Aeriscardovia sp.]|nr:hypothetical protein [Aeriscardovia sp.]